MIWVLIVIAIVLAAPFVAEVFRRPVDATLRQETMGRYADLPRGMTHFRWHGPVDGELVVCIHGLTTPSAVWDQIIPGLTDAGMRVLSYDLYGRGLSDRPSGRQDVDFFVTQLDALLAAEVPDGEVTLFGYSMGGVIATGYAHRFPDKVREVLLLAPAGIIHTPSRLTWLAARLPVLGDWLMLALFPRAVRQSTQGDLDSGGAVGQMARVQRQELDRRGYLPAVLSSLRGALMRWQDVEHAELGNRAMPVTAIWGEDDQTIPIAALGRLAQWNRAARHVTIPGAGHALGVTHADEVVRAVRENIGHHPAPVPPGPAPEAAAG